MHRNVELRITVLSQWDVTDLVNLQSHVRSILADFPKLDTVFINAGIQNHYMIFQPPNNEEVIREVTTNLIAPNLIAQSFAPHLLALAQSGTKTNLFLTSSSLAYFPLAFYPTYCATKAGVSAFAKIVRMQLNFTGCKDMNVVEVVPPVSVRFFPLISAFVALTSFTPFYPNYSNLVPIGRVLLRGHSGTGKANPLNTVVCRYSAECTPSGTDRRAARRQGQGFPTHAAPGVHRWFLRSS